MCGVLLGQQQRTEDGLRDRQDQGVRLVCAVRSISADRGSAIEFASGEECFDEGAGGEPFGRCALAGPVGQSVGDPRVGDGVGEPSLPQCRVGQVSAGEREVGAAPAVPVELDDRLVEQVTGEVRFVGVQVHEGDHGAHFLAVVDVGEHHTAPEDRLDGRQRRSAWLAAQHQAPRVQADQQPGHMGIAGQ